MESRGAQPQWQQQQQTRRRTNWTEEMNSVLLECKKKAKLMLEMKHPALMVGGRRIGLMEVMKELFERAGYEHLRFSHQNLWDQATYLKKSLGNVTGNVLSKVGRPLKEWVGWLDGREWTCESPQVLENEIHCNITVNTHTDQNANHDETDLHSRRANQEKPVGPAHCLREHLSS